MIDTETIYKVKVNGIEFLISQDEINHSDLIKNSTQSYNLIKEYRSINSKIVDEDIAAKKISIEIESEIFEVLIQDELDQMLDQMGFGQVSNKQIKEIKAPMPGLVLEINVTVGQELKEGDKVLILSAMKMENSILIHADATIKRIAVTQGEAVEKGQILVELE